MYFHCSDEGGVGEEEVYEYMIPTHSLVKMKTMSPAWGKITNQEKIELGVQQTKTHIW